MFWVRFRLRCGRDWIARRIVGGGAAKATALGGEKPRISVAPAPPPPHLDDAPKQPISDAREPRRPPPPPPTEAEGTTATPDPSIAMSARMRLLKRWPGAVLAEHDGIHTEII